MLYVFPLQDRRMVILLWLNPHCYWHTIIELVRHNVLKQWNSKVNPCKILTNSCIKLWYSLYTSNSAFFFMFSVIRNFRWKASWISWSSNFLIFFCKSSYFILRVPDLWDYININWNDYLKGVIMNAWILLLLKFSDMFFYTGVEREWHITLRIQFYCNLFM
jgi:hypothetical protein